MKVYGPYFREDGRQHVVLVDKDGNKRTKSYPRYLLEIHLGRELLITETVDHINNDFTDNRIENLQILSRQENILKQHKINPRKIYYFICPNCGTEATKYLNDVVSNRKHGKVGPFCSRKCAGQFTYKNPWNKVLS